MKNVNKMSHLWPAAWQSHYCHTDTDSVLLLLLLLAQNGNNEAHQSLSAPRASPCGIWGLHAQEGRLPLTADYSYTARTNHTVTNTGDVTASYVIITKRCAIQDAMYQKTLSILTTCIFNAHVLCYKNAHLLNSYKVDVRDADAFTKLTAT